MDPLGGYGPLSISEELGTFSRAMDLLGGYGPLRGVWTP